jgi:hypothetical protein
MKFILGLALLTSFDGSWAGKGTMIYENQVHNCTKFDLTMAQTNEELKIVTGRFECETINVDHKEFPMKIVGEELWYQNKKIGEISDGNFKAQWESYDYNTLYEFEGTIDNENFYYHEVWRDLDSGAAYLTFDGILNK